tara:strand:+ start:333 stop:470 length:138 start_codon:yes stop_codon:yes gene_type:complete
VSGSSLSAISGQGDKLNKEFQTHNIEYQILISKQLRAKNNLQKDY